MELSVAHITQVSRPDLETRAHDVEMRALLDVDTNKAPARK